MLAVLMLASCSKKQGSCLIPDNAAFVFRLDMTKMMESTGMKGDDTSTKKEIEKLIKDAGLDKEIREKLLEIVDDPTSSGIDFTEPFFAYAAPAEERGAFEGALVGCVASKGDLEDTIEKLASDNDDISLEESNGVVTLRAKGVYRWFFNRGSYLVDYTASAPIRQIRTVDRNLWDDGAPISPLTSNVFATRHD